MNSPTGSGRVEAGPGTVIFDAPAEPGFTVLIPKSALPSGTGAPTGEQPVSVTGLQVDIPEKLQIKDGSGVLKSKDGLLWLTLGEGEPAPTA